MICCKNCKMFDRIDDDMGYCFLIGSYPDHEERRPVVFNDDICKEYSGGI